MSMLKDFVKFVSAVLTGQQQSSTRFLEQLASAERYIRWGEEREDLRDYTTALNLLDECKDEDAPKPELLSRKYNAICNAAVGAIGLMIRRHRLSTDTLRQSKTDMQTEARTIAEMLKKSLSTAQSLKSEGSLIKAKEEDKHTEDLKLRLVSLKKQIESADAELGTNSAFAALTTEAGAIFQRVEASLAGLTMNQELPPQVVASLQAQVEGRMQQIRDQLQAGQAG